MNVPKTIKTWQMVSPAKKDKEKGIATEGKLEQTEIPTPSLNPGEVLVQVAGCGVCHTDIGYFYGGVPTITKPPLTLGHEIAGVIVAGDAKYIGKEVIVPAVMPCNGCAICDEGRGNRCLGQKMPGNSMGIYGGFASHIPVPVTDLCFVEDRKDFKLEELAVIADAVTTPYQACVRAGVKPGDNVVVVGATGGVGVYMNQMAKAFGAANVVGIGRNPEKLQRALQYGCDYVINSTGKDAEAVKTEFKSLSKEKKLPNFDWKIFEVTGTTPGQDIALALLSFTGKLIIVGFGMQKNEYSISKLMAFDAELIGTWGCLPKYYKNVLDWVLEGKIQIRPFMELRPMAQIKQAFEDAHGEKLTKRIVLVPDTWTGGEKKGAKAEAKLAPKPEGPKGALSWLPREDEIRDHRLFKGEEYWGIKPPCTMYEKRQVVDPQGNPVEGLYTVWITLNNPGQLNSYTTEMVKGVIAGFHNASLDRSVVAVIFTGAGDRAFCTGGNTKEYAEYYSKRPNEYGEYMELFNHMVDSILFCKKPVISRVNGMRVAGGQEIGMACDLAISSDLAIFGQAGPRHGSAPDGGSSDFLPWYMGIEDAMWNCVSCEMWSAYKMKRLGFVSKVVPVIKNGNIWVRNPQIVTEKWVDDGEIVYGEFKTGDELKKAKDFLKTAPINFELLDKAVNEMIWTFTNLFPGCLIKSIDSIRAKKKFFWDYSKNYNRHWLAANMSGEAFLGFNAFNTKKITGKDTIDFVKFRQLTAQGQNMEEPLFEAVLGKPQK